MDPSATQLDMADDADATDRALVDALDEPTLLVVGTTIQIANPGAERVLGAAIEGRDIRLAVRHPQALELILAHRSGEVDVSGIGEAGHAWRLHIRHVGHRSVLVRMFDRADVVAAEKMRVDFVANASHELRTPLSTVLGYAETLAEESDLPSELRAKFGRTIRDEAGRMLRIIEDLMSLSRIEADRFVAPAESADIGEIVGTAVANAGQLRGAGGCEFRVAIPEDLPLVRGDRAQLAQLLDNLIGNAVRYGCEKAGSTVDITAVRRGKWVNLSVTDHGPGIAREHLARVTERFYRVDAARSREKGGTGLGLAIVKHIVERHKGTLDIKSAIGSGTSVTVGLPAAP